MKKTKTNLSKCLAISIVYMNSMNPHLYGSQSVEDFSDGHKKGSSHKSKIEVQNLQSQLRNFSGSTNTIEISDFSTSRTGNTFSPQTRKFAEKGANIDIEVPPQPLVSGGRLMEEKNVLSSERDEHYHEKNQKKKSRKKPRMESSKSPSPQTKKFTKRDKDIEEPAPVLLSDEPIDTENALGDDSKPHLEIVPQENKQESQEKGLGLPKIKTRSLPLEEEAQGDHTGYTGQTALPEKEKQEKHVSHKNGKQENVREFNSDESQESDDYEADYIEGVLDAKGIELLKNSKYLHLHSIHPPTGIKNSKYFKNSTLIVSPKTINPKVKRLSFQLCNLGDEDIEDIGNFNKLKKLEIIWGGITDSGVNYITQLSNLEHLNLNSNQITDAGVKEISKLTNLKILDLSLNEDITYNGVSSLRGIEKLEELSINQINITQSQYETIRGWRIWKRLDYFPLH